MPQGRPGLERVVAAAIVLLPLGLVFLRCGLDPSVPFVVQRPGAPWIMAPSEVSAQLQQWGVREAPVVVFARHFAVPDPVPPDVVFELSVVGGARLFLNGQELPQARRQERRGRSRRRIAVGFRLRPGENDLRVEVANLHGPALLSLRSEGLPQPLATGNDWSVREGGRLHARALLADDTRTDARSLAVETPREAIGRVADTLLLLFLLGALGFAGARQWRRAPAGLWGSVLVPLAASAGWLYLYAAKAAHIPMAVGFDARHHIQYLDILHGEGRIPLAAEGWSTYHPPLFYAVAAFLRGLGAGDAGQKALPLLSGLLIVWVAWLLARLLVPGRPLVAGVATLFAAVLPVNVYTAAYFSNEATHALLASAALVALVHWLLADGPAWRGLLVSAVLFGLAALTKFTALVTVPVALFFVAWKLLLVERGGARRAAAGTLAFAAAFLAVAGWFYARNQWHYGLPVVGNWALPGEGRVWWQQPGFHTVAWYTGFGESLVHPYLAGFHSFWDAVYCTLWGDGYIGGRADPHQRHDYWSYDFMSAGYWVALPAAGLLLAGGGMLLARTLGAGPARQRLALGFLATCVWAVALAFFQLTLQLPFFAQAKAAYLLLLAAPLALAFATGFAGLDDCLARRAAWPARAILYGWLSLFVGTLFLGFAG